MAEAAAPLAVPSSSSGPVPRCSARSAARRSTWPSPAPRASADAAAARVAAPARRPRLDAGAPPPHARAGRQLPRVLDPGPQRRLEHRPDRPRRLARPQDHAARRSFRALRLPGDDGRLRGAQGRPATCPARRSTPRSATCSSCTSATPTPSSGQAVTMHPHGVRYNPEYDGAYLGKYTRAGGFVAPGEEFTYFWECVPDAVGAWPYHDHGPNHTLNTFRGAVRRDRDQRARRQGPRRQLHADAAPAARRRSPASTAPSSASTGARSPATRRR